MQTKFHVITRTIIANPFILIRATDWHRACSNRNHRSIEQIESDPTTMTAQQTIPIRDSQISAKKQTLLEKKRELKSSHITREDIAIEKTPEEMDEIQLSADRVLALGALTRNWETSTLIDEALERVENGTYGICAECDEPISEKRLRAIPWAKYCINCQDQLDRARAEEEYA